jgi:predicted molibdopterin-dependent oxidoreductase YjgC
MRLTKFARGDAFDIEVDGNKVLAYEGETIAAVLLAAGIRSFQQNRVGNQPNRLFCGMGVCMQCLVKVNGIQSNRACKTLVQAGMKIETLS